MSSRKDLVALAMRYKHSTKLISAKSNNLRQSAIQTKSPITTKSKKILIFDPFMKFWNIGLPYVVQTRLKEASTGNFYTFLIKFSNP